MALERGSKLGPYEILGPLGAGGMGEVYGMRRLSCRKPLFVILSPNLKKET